MSIKISTCRRFHLNEMVRNGLNVEQMNQLLMKKVEELTLYLIEMKAEVKELQKQKNISKKSK